MPCPQPLLIHTDATGRCDVPGCVEGVPLVEAVRDHPLVDHCRVVLADRCPVCHRAGTGDAAEGTASDDPCPGSAVVHIDLSLECSEPNCRASATPALWLARHADIRSCRFLSTDCTLCATEDAPARAEVVPGPVDRSPARGPEPAPRT